ncbi:acetate--CoA ligase family protein [Pseudonocardia yuanmonensis]|uniref:acetate--CoA ligase family protein n=1 Tax=Pseudonocardia yuanmonensis TaxID=1095914 RepID=UPI0031EADF0A
MDRAPSLAQLDPVGAQLGTEALSSTSTSTYCEIAEQASGLRDPACPEPSTTRRTALSAADRTPVALDHDAALALLRSLRSWPLPAGHRGSAPRDVDAAAAAVVAVPRAIGHPDLAELEINPLIVGREGAVAVDVLVRHTEGT